MEPLELYGTIDDAGKMTIQNRPRLDEWARQNTGRNIKLRLERRGKKRSSPQNRYYHGVVIREITIRLRDLGYQELQDETVHEMMKIKFNYDRLISEQGEALEIPKSTTGLTTTQFMEYMDKIKQWASDFLNIYIPDPNEKLTIEF